MRKAGFIIAAVSGVAFFLLLLAMPGGGGGVAPPIPGVDKIILVVEDKEARRNLPPKQLSIFAAGDVADFATTNGFVMRILDKGAQITPGPIKSAVDTVLAKPTLKLPWLVISNKPAGKGYDGVLPADVPEMKALLESKK